MLVDVHREDERGNVFRTAEPISVLNFVVPVGFESDGASVPRFFWRIVFPPSDTRALRAAIVHDYLYRVHPAGWTKQEADRLFYELMKADGVPEFNARLAYWGVNFFGGKSWRAGGK